MKTETYSVLVSKTVRYERWIKVKIPCSKNAHDAEKMVRRQLKNKIEGPLAENMEEFKRQRDPDITITYQGWGG